MFLTRTPDQLFKLHVTGTLELTGGGLAHLVVVAVLHIEPDGSVRVHVDRFELKLIGG